MNKKEIKFLENLKNEIPEIKNKLRRIKKELRKLKRGHLNVR